MGTSAQAGNQAATEALVSLAEAVGRQERGFRFTRPALPPLGEVVRLYEQAYKDGLLTNSNLVARLEGAARERLGVRHAVAVSSCTSGLLLTLKALGVRGRVILPSFTFFATGLAVLWNGLRPVFADCLESTWNLDPEDAGRRIDGGTGALIGVHLYGNPCQVEALERLAARTGLKLVFDGAHALGSLYQGKPLGGFGDAEVFSLSPTKLLVAGEGGLVATNDSTLARLIRLGRNYGDGGDYDPELPGLNARMSEFHAALALEGWELLEEKVRRHNQIAAHYDRLLQAQPGLSLQQVRRGDRSSFKDYSVLVDPAVYAGGRDLVGSRLLGCGIETKRYFHPPLHRQKIFREYFDPQGDALPVTERVSSRVLSLPIYATLADEVVERIAEAIAELGKTTVVVG